MAEISKLEAGASEACTRAGAFALLLSLALASLIPAWIHRHDEIALGRYLTLRLNLAAALDALDENPLWQEWRLKHETESVAIENLARIRVNSTTLAPIEDATPDAAPRQVPDTKAPPAKQPTAAPRTPRRDAAGRASVGSVAGSERLLQVAYGRTQFGPTYTPGDPRAPAPPSGLGLVVGFGEAQQAADYLAQLNDTDLLTRSRNASDFFNLSIYRWVLKRDSLIAQHLRRSEHVATLSGPTDPQSPANFTPAADKTALLNLSLGAVRELARAELPPISNTVKLGADENEVEITPTSLPRSLYGASLFGQLLLFFVVVYFGAFARQATSAAGFPSQETLFGAFVGARSTLAVFLLALCTPLLVSVAILVLSFGATSGSGSFGLALCTALIGLAVFSLYVDLDRKFYFHTLLKRASRVVAQPTTAEPTPPSQPAL